MRKKIAIPMLLALCSLPALAQEDPCTTFSEQKLGDYFTGLSARISDNFNKRGVDTAKDQATKDTADALASHANGDGVTGSQIDLIRRAFVALSLGQVQQNDGSLIFNFNPDTLSSGMGQFSPRVIVNKPLLLNALDQKIDTLSLSDTDRQSLKDGLKKDLGDLDDVEAHLRWTQASGTPRQLLQNIANDIYKDAYVKAKLSPKFQELGNTVNTLWANFKNQAKLSDDTTIGKVCEDPDKAAMLQNAVKDVEKAGTAALTALHDALTQEQFFALADLIEGERKLTAEASFRRRVGAAGPNEGTFSLRYEFGSVSYSSMKDWAKTNKKMTGPNKDVIPVSAVQEYLKTRPSSIPDFSVTLDYTKTQDFHFPLPGDEALDASGSHKLSATLHGGMYLGSTRDRRLDLDATYDDVTDDPTRHDRFVASLSWTENLTAPLAKVAGGSQLVVKLVYANKPEFLGDIDKDLGVRFGLKWSVGGTSSAQ